MWFALGEKKDGAVKRGGMQSLSILQNCKEILATQAKENQSAVGFF